jgi:hypothetical protein
MLFTNSASAGNARIEASAGEGSSVQFRNRSSAGSATFSFDDVAGSVNFFNSSTAGSALIAGFDALRLSITFHDNSTAGTAPLLLAGEEGSISFFNHPSAGSATIFGGSLVLNPEGADFLTHELRGDFVFIGRAPSNHIVVDHPAVPAQHALLLRSPRLLSADGFELNEWDTD